MTLRLEPGEHITCAVRGTRGMTGEHGTLVLTTKRIMFVRRGPPKGLLRRRRVEILFSSDRDELARVEVWEQTRFLVEFRDGSVEPLELDEPESDAALRHWGHAVRGRDEVRDADPWSSLGVVTAWICSTCRPPCTCARPNLIPRALAGWQDPFSHMGLRQITRVLDGVSDAPVRREDVVEIVSLATGNSHGSQWCAIVRLRDRRWAYVRYYEHVVHDDADRSVCVAASFESLWSNGLTEEQRVAIVGKPGEERDAELVLLDDLMQSDDAAMRAWAEARMHLLKRTGALG